MKSKVYIFLILFFILSGCTNQKNNVNKQSIENKINNINPINENQTSQNKIKVKGSMEEFDRSNPYNIPDQVNRINRDTLSLEYNSKRANHIAESLTSLPEIEKTTVIITGNTALVGVHLASNIRETQIDEIKKSIEQKTFSTDASLKNVSVTASPEIVEKITEIAQNLSQGRPITGLTEEIGSIIRRVTPTV